MANYYQNKLCFVFGGSEGIGAAVCEQLVSSGARVVAFSRSEKKLSELQRKIKKVDIQTLDITNFEAVQSTIQSCLEKFGTPEIVMNFAGVARPGFVDRLDLAEYEKMMQLNYFGTVHVVKAMAPSLMQRKSGQVVTCSSMAGFLGLFGYTGYCASKFAVIGFSEALRREWAPLGIKVSVLCPPNTRTPGLEEENKTKPAEVLATEEKVAVVEPEYVARQLLKSLPRNEFLIVPTFDGKMANVLNRLSPRIIDLFVKRKEANI